MDISRLDKICSLKLIKNDCDTYLKFFATNKDSVVSMFILPYIALMCVETQNFVGEIFFDEPYNKIFQDMRNDLKQFMDRYGKQLRNLKRLMIFKINIFCRKLDLRHWVK